jgi:hypothetical protein
MAPPENRPSAFGTEGTIDSTANPIRAIGVAVGDELDPIAHLALLQPLEALAEERRRHQLGQPCGRVGHEGDERGHTELSAI